MMMMSFICSFRNKNEMHVESSWVAMVYVYACVGQGMHTTMALRRKNASFSAHKEPLSGTQQQASHKEAEVFVAVVQRWRDG